MKKILKYISISLLIVSVFSVNAMAQLTVKGTVKDSKGESVIGAVVMLKGNNTVAAVTDTDGNYSLNIPSSVKDAVLSASCLGYKTADVAVQKRAVIDFVLEEENEELEATVVVGYGAMRRSDLTGSVTSVKIDEGDASRSNNIAQLLQGHAAGVQVVADNASPDSGVTINIRGMSSFYGNTQPLYVIDGIILNDASTSESALTVGSYNEDSEQSVNGLMGLNPSDIASIEVLKDASATAIYGALGANGVILITTKQANSERPSIQFSAGVDVGRMYKKMDLLNFDEYVSYLKDLQNVSSSVISGSATSMLNNIYEDPETRSGLKVTPIDWQDYVSRTAISQRYHLSISGRPKTLSYSFSLGYNNKQGIIRNSDAQQLSSRINVEKKIGKHIKIGTKTNVAFVFANQTQSSGKVTANTSLIRSVLQFRPYTGVDFDDDVTEDDILNSNAGPDRWMHDFMSTRKEIRITPSIYVNLSLPAGFAFKSTFGGDLRDYQMSKFKSSRINSTSEGSAGGKSDTRNLNWNWDNTLSYKLKKGGHRLNAMLGSAANYSSSTVEAVQGWNIVQYRGLINSLPTAPNASLAYTEGANTTLSFFARGIYSFKDRYVLTATYRVDGSSKFYGRNKWSSFPSLAFAWRMSEEPWFKNDVVSSTKIRLGWGRVGNQAISRYQTLSNFMNVTYADHTITNPAQYSIGLIPENIANPDLKWETTEQTNVGLDFGMWAGRLALTVDAYYKKTFDLLNQKNIATSSGFSAMWVNEGTILNKGLEITLEGTPVKTSNFEWSLSGNISFNRNRIVSISNSATKDQIYLDKDNKIDAVFFYGSTVGSSNYGNAPANVFIEGYPMGLFYGYKTEGIVQEGETSAPLEEGSDPQGPGNWKIVDTNKNGYIDSYDRMIIGDPNPDFTFGLSTSLSYKRFTLSIAANGSYGNDIVNINSLMELDTGSTGYKYNSLRRAYFDAWSPTNTTGAYPALGAQSSTEARMIKSNDVEDGSYLRLSSVSLSYDIPIAKQKAKVVKGINLALTGGNLWVFTKYKGWNPEVNSFGNNVRKRGIDAGAYPSSRTFSFDVKLSF